MKNDKCFAFDDEHPERCKVLIELNCAKCKFYKTEEEFKKGYERDKKRLEEIKREKEGRKNVQGN